jgi:hypothetical protein
MYLAGLFMDRDGPSLIVILVYPVTASTIPILLLLPGSSRQPQAPTGVATVGEQHGFREAVDVALVRAGRGRQKARVTLCHQPSGVVMLTDIHQWLRWAVTAPPVSHLTHVQAPVVDNR